MIFGQMRKCLAASPRKPPPSGEAQPAGTKNQGVKPGTTPASARRSLWADEVKLGSEKGIEDGVKPLTALSKKIDTDAMHAPSFFMILTASGDFSYRRDDGILVVPIGCLKP